jgi:hypothetical protein
VHRPTRAVTVALLTLALMLATVTAAATASARQQVQIYRGRTSEGGPVGAYVVKKESGRRMLRAVYAGYQLSCSADASVQGWVVLFSALPGWPLNEHHRVRVGLNDGQVAVHFAGRLAWGKGSGHTRLGVAELTQDEQPQLCRSSWPEWHLTRRPLKGRSASPSVPKSKGFIHVAIRAGVPHVIEFRLPADV